MFGNILKHSVLESGASSNKCSETYMGSEPFSEIEFRNIRDYVLALDPKPILAHCLHSYSQLWLYPYGYAHNALPENWQEIVRDNSRYLHTHTYILTEINITSLYTS